MKMFVEHEKTCCECRHERCEQCVRHPPKKAKAEPSQEVLRSLEAKMAKVKLDSEQGLVKV